MHVTCETTKQGTGAVVAAGVINGLKLQGVAPADARLLFFGAGSSAVGVASAIACYLQHEAGVDPDTARRSLYMVDTQGLITTSRGDDLPPHKRRFARRPEDGVLDARNLVDVIAGVKPHALVGLSAAGPSWGEDAVRELCRHVDRPLILPLSNPTDKAEITAEQAVGWSGGRCVFASGSPFAAVEFEGRRVEPGQANNVFIVPGERIISQLSLCLRTARALCRLPTCLQAGSLPRWSCALLDPRTCAAPQRCRRGVRLRDGQGPRGDRSHVHRRGGGAGGVRGRG